MFFLGIWLNETEIAPFVVFDCGDYQRMLSQCEVRLDEAVPPCVWRKFRKLETLGRKADLALDNIWPLEIISTFDNRDTANHTSCATPHHRLQTSLSTTSPSPVRHHKLARNLGFPRLPHTNPPIGPLVPAAPSYFLNLEYKPLLRRHHPM